MTALSRLQRWYASQCDGDWEHSYGITIETLDNPGWSMSIDLEGTQLSDVEISPIEIDRSDHDWLRCFVEGPRLRLVGGPENLEEMIALFLDIADRRPSSGS